MPKRGSQGESLNGSVSGTCGAECYQKSRYTKRNLATISPETIIATNVFQRRNEIPVHCLRKSYSKSPVVLQICVEWSLLWGTGTAAQGRYRHAGFTVVC